MLFLLIIRKFLNLSPFEKKNKKNKQKWEKLVFATIFALCDCHIIVIL